MTDPTSHTSGGPDRSHRYGALDGLRGLAALVVVVHHSLLVVPSLANPYNRNPSPPNTGDGWLLFSPVHDLWDGTVAVYVFFILSGFVLTIPALRMNVVWRSYYPQRLLRLYVPTCAAVLLALLLFRAFPRIAAPDASWWVNHHAFTPTFRSVVGDAALLRGVDTLNTALWSLRWEVVFSLLLPVYITVCRRGSRHWLAVYLLLQVVIVVGAKYNALQGAMTYLPMFAIGSVLAFARADIERVVSRFTERFRLGWTILIAMALVLINSKWMALGLGADSDWVQSSLVAVQTVGASVFVLAALWSGLFRRGLETTVFQWLGARSFSLYLVHEPIVVSVAMMLDANSKSAVFLFAGPISLLVAELFYRAVERPSHRLAKRTGRLFGGVGAASRRSNH